MVHGNTLWLCIMHGKSSLAGNCSRKLSKTCTFHFHTRPPSFTARRAPTMLQLTSSALPSKPNCNGSSLLGPKAALQAPPSTLVLSSPHPQQLISQQSDTSPICCTPWSYHSFPHYQDAEFFSWVNISIPPFHNVQQHLEILFQMLLLEMQTMQLQKEFWDLICTTMSHPWTQHQNLHLNYLFIFFKVSYRRKRTWMVTQSCAAHCSWTGLTLTVWDVHRTKSVHTQRDGGLWD